jgi:hypothetical protein
MWVLPIHLHGLVLDDLLPFGRKVTLRRRLQLLSLLSQLQALAAPPGFFGPVGSVVGSCHTRESGIMTIGGILPPAVAIAAT